MDIRDKSKILSEFISKYQHAENESMQAFIKTHNLGLPLAYAFDANWIEIKDAVVTYFIESTYDDLVEFFMCDPSIEYSSVDEMLPF